MLEHAYATAAKVSVLRRLFVDLIASFENVSALLQSEHHLVTWRMNYLRDLAIALWIKVPAGSVQNALRVDRCQYHLHKASERCVVVAGPSAMKIMIARTD